MIKIKGVVQHYAWGKLGASSAVAKLQAAGEGVAIDDTKPYAEYWFGTHPNGPATVEGGSLQSWLSANSESAGCHPSGNLPYLFKVLSVAKALSIQAHPDKKLAERLHEESPSIYKDDNHKPEMALALTPFQGLCGFRAITEIADHLRLVPELRALVGDEAASTFETFASGYTPETDAKAPLRALFSQVMTASDDIRTKQTMALATRLGSAEESSLSVAEQVSLRLCSEFPEDIGVFAPFLLNVLTLAPGQAMFLAANEPHAYLSGDCVECMACSDNVVRAGLTPKLKDVPTLLDMLTYSPGKPNILEGDVAGPYTRVFKPPVPEFLIETTTLPPGASVELDPIQSAAIILVTSGSGVATVRSDEGTEPETMVISAGMTFMQSASAACALSAASPAVTGTGGGAGSGGQGAGSGGGDSATLSPEAACSGDTGETVGTLRVFRVHAQPRI